MIKHLAKRESIQKRESTLPIHASYYQQIRKHRIAKKDKRCLVYIFFLLSFSLLFLSRCIISARYQFFALARAAIWQQYTPPESNLFDIFLLLTLALGLYALLATFYRQVPTQYFLSLSILLLLFPPVFLGMELYSMHRYHAGRSAEDAQFLLQVLKQELLKQELLKQEIESEQELQIEEISERILSLSTSFPFVHNIGIKNPSHLILSCSRHTCLGFKQAEESEEYQLAESLFREAKHRIFSGDFQIYVALWYFP